MNETRQCHKLHQLLGCVALLLLCSVSTCSADASRFDALPLIEQHAQHLTTSDLTEVLSLHADILAQHNVRWEAHALQQYVDLLRTVLLPDCCDYFTALPTVKGLERALSDVLELQLPAALRPLVRRSYVGAVWLLQRSRFFKWDSSSLQKSALSGMQKLYDAHVASASGRPSSLHHISKAGGTSLCYLAWESGCRGPGMSKKDNCLLDIGSDSPVWVLRHNVTEVNRLAAVPPPPPAPPVMADPQAEAERLRLAAVRQRVMKTRSYDWWMYDCPGVRPGVGRPCSELQEGAVSKAATFFASENTLPTEHGQPKVCEEFMNVVMLRDAVSEVVSLMTEVSVVYTRLLKQHRVLGWAPPKWDLAWWQQWAPAVVNSYATRTLLGAAAYCPAAPPSQARPAAPGAGVQADQDSTTLDGSSSRELLSGSSSSSQQPWSLSADDVTRALRVLASFDVVLDLGSRELMDASLAKLLGWTDGSFSQGQHQRGARSVTPPPWDQLDLLARQQPLPLNGTQQQQQAAAAAELGSGVAAAAGDAPPWDDVRRLIGEVRVRQVYSSAGLSNVLLPMVPDMPLLQPPAAVVAAAVAALAAARTGQLSVQNSTDGSGGSSHLLVQLQLDQAAQPSAAPSSTAGGGGGAAAAAAGSVVSYHVWPGHSVVLTELQYQQLLQATAGDAQLYRTSRVLQVLDAGWVALLGTQRKVRKLLQQVEEEAKAACGFAGLNHMQQ